MDGSTTSVPGAGVSGTIVIGVAGADGSAAWVAGAVTVSVTAGAGGGGGGV
jgi:hypothetical protein